MVGPARFRLTFKFYNYMSDRRSSFSFSARFISQLLHNQGIIGEPRIRQHVQRNEKISSRTNATDIQKERNERPLVTKIKDRFKLSTTFRKESEKEGTITLAYIYVHSCIPNFVKKRQRKESCSNLGACRYRLFAT